MRIFCIICIVYTYIIRSWVTIELVFAGHVGRTRNSHVGVLYSRVFISVKRIWVPEIEHKSRMNGTGQAI